MKVLILTDLEGVSGVDSIDMMTEGEGYEIARKEIMADVNVAVEGALSGGADKVFVIDGHYQGKNFIMELLTDKATYLPCSDFVKTEASGYDALVCLGCHAMAGTEMAFLDHTQNSRTWFEYKVGGIPYGEIGQQAITLGAFDTPLVAVTGDKAACDEAAALIKGVETAAVKTAIVRNRANCLPTDEARKLIFEAVCDGVKRYREIKPYTVNTPTEVSVTLVRNDITDEYMAQNPNLKRCGRTVSKTVNEIKTYNDLVKFF